MIDKAEILADLDRYMDEYPPTQEGDITVSDIAERYNIATRSAIHRMEKIAKDHPDEWSLLQVAHKANGWCWVLRKVG
jgi:hypothetical protein